MDVRKPAGLAFYREWEKKGYAHPIVREDISRGARMGSYPVPDDDNPYMTAKDPHILWVGKTAPPQKNYLWLDTSTDPWTLRIGSGTTITESGRAGTQRSTTPYDGASIVLNQPVYVTEQNLVIVQEDGQGQDMRKYAFLPGRSGGQTFIGGPGGTDDLTLQSGQNVLLNPSGGKTGVGTDTPGAIMEVNGNAGVTTGLKISNLGTATKGIDLSNSGLSGIGDYWIYNAVGHEWSAAGKFQTDYAIFSSPSNGVRTDVLKPYTIAKDLTFVLLNNDYAFSFEDNTWGELVVIRGNGNMGVATTQPSEKFDVDGQIRMRQGTPGADKLIAGDANGVMNWVKLLNVHVDDAAAIGWAKISKTGSSINDLADVTISSPDAGELIRWSGAVWENWDPNFLAETLASAKIFVGNASDVATARDMGGDISIDNLGVTAIVAGVIVDADINAGAAIAWSKISKAGSSLADLVTRNHSDIQNIGTTDHHSNANDPTSDEKAALAGEGTPSATNKYVTKDHADDNYINENGDSGMTGAFDFGGATSLEVPNNTNPSLDACGEIAVNTAGMYMSGQNPLVFYDGSQIEYVVSTHESPADGEIIRFNGAAGQVNWEPARLNWIPVEEQSSDPDDPPEGTSVFWQSNGSGTGDDGDVLMKTTAASTTKTTYLSKKSPPDYTLSNVNTDRVLDADSTDVAELADVLGTLINDLTAMGILQ